MRPAPTEGAQATSRTQAACAVAAVLISLLTYFSSGDFSHTIIWWSRPPVTKRGFSG